MTSQEYMDMNMMDALIDRPHEFYVGEKQFFLHHPTLGVSVIVSRLIPALGLVAGDANILTVVSKHRDIALRILAFYTMRNKAEICNDVCVGKRINELGELDDKGLAALLTMALSMDNYDEFIRSCPLGEDMKKKQNAIKIKDMKNSLVFGGTTLFGSLLDTACQRYGFSLYQIQWEIPLVTLKLMLADGVTSMYMDDKDMRKYNATNKSGGGLGGFIGQLKSLKGLGRKK